MNVVPCCDMVSSNFGGDEEVRDQTRTVASREAEIMASGFGKLTARTCKELVDQTGPDVCWHGTSRVTS